MRDAIERAVRDSLGDRSREAVGASRKTKKSDSMQGDIHDNDVLADADLNSCDCIVLGYVGRGESERTCGEEVTCYCMPV